MSYPYTEQNRLVVPHTYMYSPFQGLPLLHGYLSDRDAAMRRHAARAERGSLSDRALAIRAFHALERLLNAMAPEAEQHVLRRTVQSFFDVDSILDREYGDSSNPLIASLDTMTISDSVATQDLLLGLIVIPLTGKAHESATTWLDRLVQRFEVTKKLYHAYQPGFRTGDGPHDSLRLYWLFALALCLYYGQSRDIRYLNSLLKACDVLCSTNDATLATPNAGIVLVVAFESVCVRLLAQSKGVPLATG